MSPRATCEFPQHFPEPGWVEHDPQAIWRSVIAALGEIANTIDMGRVTAIGVTNQRETTVLWDRRTGQAIHNAVVWQDRRTADQCQKLKTQGHEDKVREVTGLVLDPYFSATKMAWWILDPRGRSSRSRCRRACPGRDHRHLHSVAADARGRACHGAKQRVANTAVAAARCVMGRRHVGIVFRSKTNVGRGSTERR